MDNGSQTILMIHGDREQPAQHWKARFEDAGFVVQRVDDVYSAMARLGKGSIEPAAVLVCVDFLDPSEFEFFDLIRRGSRQTAVYAYSSAGVTGKLERAVRAGARDRLTPESFETLLNDIGLRSQAPPGGSLGSEATQVSQVQHTVEAPDASEGSGEVRPCSLAGAAAPSDCEEPAGQAEPQRPRVPWRQESGRPVRIPPGQQACSGEDRPADDATVSQPDGAVPDATAPSSHPAAEEPGDEVFEGPLLTPEELELLMNDGFRTRAPD